MNVEANGGWNKYGTTVANGHFYTTRAPFTKDEEYFVKKSIAEKVGMDPFGAQVELRLEATHEYGDGEHHTEYSFTAFHNGSGYCNGAKFELQTSR